MLYLFEISQCLKTTDHNSHGRRVNGWGTWVNGVAYVPFLHIGGLWPHTRPFAPGPARGKDGGGGEQGSDIPYICISIVCVCVCVCVCVYPLIYTPLPNCRWLHHTALRCVRRVELGACMSHKGLNSVKTCSKWAHFTCLCTPNGLGSIFNWKLEKRVFDPFLIHFWSHNGPFSRHFGIFHGPKRITMASKRAKNTRLSIPNGPG